MYSIRWIVFMVALLLFCSPAGHGLAGLTRQDTDSENLVIDPEHSTLLRQSFYLEDLSAVLAPVLTPDFLAWVGKRHAEAAEALAALLSAKAGEVAVLASKKGYLFTLELPEGNLERLAAGEVTVDALSAAFGSRAAPLLIAMMPQAGLDVRADVQPGIHRLRPDCFYTVVEKRLLLGSTDVLVEVSRNKLRSGNHITAIPDDKQQVWTKTDLQIRCAPSPEGPFANRNISYEYTLRKTPEGFTYAASSNLPELLPALEDLPPVSLDDMALFGNTPPLYSLVFSPKILDVLTRVSVKGLSPRALGIPSSDQFPFSLDDFERVGLFFGGVKARVLGYPVPGVIVAVKGKPEPVALLQAMATGASPVQWAQKTLDGWDAFFTAEMVLVDKTPIPVPLFLGRRGGSLVFGLMNHEELGLPNDGSALFAQLPAGTQTNIWADMDVQGLWEAVRDALKPGSALRLTSQLDAKLTRPQVAAVEALLRTTPPVQRLSAWSSPDLRHAEGRIVESAGSDGFMARLCELVDAFVP